MLRLVVLLTVCYLTTAAVVHHDRQQSGETQQADPTEEELAAELAAYETYAAGNDIHDLDSVVDTSKSAGSEVSGMYIKNISYINMGIFFLYNYSTFHWNALLY